MKLCRILLGVLLWAGLGWAGPLTAALRIEVGNHVAPAGTNQFQIPIQITGGDLVTDMVGAIQIGWDGGPLVGGEPGPRIQSLSYAGSIWAGAIGGYDTNATIALPGQLYDPNVSLRTGGQQVPGQGRLFTLTIDVTGIAPGLHELRLVQVQGFGTRFENAGTEVPVTIVNGVIAVGTTIPVSPPRLSIGTLTNGLARLSFPSEAGWRYRVQWKGDVIGAWREIRNDLVGTGNEIVWVDDGTAIGQLPGAAGGRRFYRIRVVK